MPLHFGALSSDVKDGKSSAKSTRAVCSSTTAKLIKHAVLNQCIEARGGPKKSYFSLFSSFCFAPPEVLLHFDADTQSWEEEGCSSVRTIHAAAAVARSGRSRLRYFSETAVWGRAPW